MTAPVPPPGSPEAKDAGCRCPVMDNAHGAGLMGGVLNPDGSVAYVMRGDCPLHGWEEERDV